MRTDLFGWGHFSSSFSTKPFGISIEYHGDTDAATLQVKEVKRTFAKGECVVHVGDLVQTVNGEDATRWSFKHFGDALNAWDHSKAALEIEFCRPPDITARQPEVFACPGFRTDWTGDQQVLCGGDMQNCVRVDLESLLFPTETPSKVLRMPVHKLHSRAPRPMTTEVIRLCLDLGMDDAAGALTVHGVKKLEILKDMATKECFIEDLRRMGVDERSAKTLSVKLRPADPQLRQFKAFMSRGLKVVRLRDASLFSLYKSEDRILWMDTVCSKLFLGASKTDTKTCIVCNLDDITEVVANKAHPLRIEVKRKQEQSIKIQLATPRTQELVASCLTTLMKQANTKNTKQAATMSFLTPPSGSLDAEWV
jgi:hypothetical protein